METDTKPTANRRRGAKSPPPVPSFVEGVPRLATFEVTAQIFSAAGATPQSIRADIFKAEDRTNSRGEKITGNGLGASGAIVRRGRKVLIDIDRYGPWLAGRKYAPALGK